MRYNNLDKLAVFSPLTNMAKKPYNLTLPGAISKERIETYTTEMADFKLLYATQRIDNECLGALQSLADESSVVDQFIAMKRGAVINKIEGYDSENRMVLHTAVRDIFQKTANHPEATCQAKEELAKLKKFLEDLQSGQVTASEAAHEKRPI